MFESIFGKFQYYNPNPKGRENGDCAVRALCAAGEGDWDTVYKRLCDIGFEIKDMPNSKAVIETYLKRYGFTKHSIRVTRGSRRPTVLEMARLSRDGKIYICKTAHHLVTCRDGMVLDLWDSRQKSLYSYWIKDRQEGV